MITKYTGINDMHGQPIHEHDSIEGVGSNGYIIYKIVWLNEDGFHGWYAENIQGSREMRVMLSAMSNIRIVARVK